MEADWVGEGLGEEEEVGWAGEDWVGEGWVEEGWEGVGGVDLVVGG